MDPLPHRETGLQSFSESQRPKMGTGESGERIKWSCSSGVIQVQNLAGIQNL